MLLLSVPPARRTPSKSNTPKRKNKSALQWPNQQADRFLDLCLRWKDDLQGSKIPLRVWLDVNTQMHSSGYTTVTAQQCKDKFDIMYSFFSKTLIKSGGYVAGVKWGQYEAMCQLFDLPPDYILEENEGSEEEIEDEEDSGPYKRKGELQLVICFTSPT